MGSGLRWWAVAAWLLVPALAGAVELRRLEAFARPEGASVRLVLSAPVRVAVRAVGEDVRRLYVDLPAGTRLGRGVAGPATAAGPVARLRVGVGDGGVVRVVLDLAEPVTHRLLRSGAIVTLRLSRLAPGPAAAGLVGPPVPPPARTVAAGLARPKIVLDPGHGGRDPGARGFAIEKEVTLAITRRLAVLLRERANAEVILTRTADVTLSLPERTARANAEGADLFLSIHANSNPGKRLHGIETYYLNNTDDHATIRLAAMENGLDLLTPVEGPTDLRYILSDLVQVGKEDESITLARDVQRSLVSGLRARYGGVADLGVKQGPFYVLVGAYMPCVLVETSFLSHPVEGRRLASAAYRNAVAEGLYRGIARFLADARRARTL